MRRALVLTLALVLGGCNGPTPREYFAGREPDREWVVRVWAARLPSVLKALAVHTSLELCDPNGGRETWEVWQDPIGEDGSHVLHRPGGGPHEVGGGPPTLVWELRGEKAKTAVLWLREQAPAYRRRHFYLAWPGPNSNTYVADLVRDCPGLRVDLPSTAIGKDWAGFTPIRTTTTGTGLSLDVLVVGVKVGLIEGVEAQVLGLTFGVAFWPPALKLPGVGRLGVPTHVVSDAR